MVHHCWFIFFLVFSSLVGALYASPGDRDPLYRTCIGECGKTGCVGLRCFPHCKFSSDGASLDGPWYFQEPLYLRWKQWDCQSDCRYYCMLHTENERAELGLGTVKYHGKWPFKRVHGFQEPVSVIFSALNLAMHFHGWLSFFILLYYKLPLKADKKPYYEYAGLWHLHGLLSMNAWFWSAIFHSRDVNLTEKLNYSSAVAFFGYSLSAAIVRSFNVKTEAARVMVAAPLVAFVTTHILYLNNYKMDYGWNMKVYVVMAVAELLIWAVWAGVTSHPSRRKLWLVVVGRAFAMLLEIFDFPPYQGFVDAHALWHATAIPVTYIWWNFIKDDAEFQTSNLLKKLSWGGHNVPAKRRRCSLNSAPKFTHPIPPLISNRSRPPKFLSKTRISHEPLAVVPSVDSQSGPTKSTAPFNTTDDSISFVGQGSVPVEVVIQFENPSSSSSLFTKWSRVALLAGGDVLALLLFSAIGRFSHGYSVVDTETLRTADPFVAGWFLSAYFLGGYGEQGRGMNRRSKAIIAAARSWSLGIPVGLAIRAATVGHFLPTNFILVTMGGTAILLIGWRALLFSLFLTDKTKNNDVYKRGSPFELFELLTSVVQRW